MGCSCECIEDRGQAIRRAVEECREKTVVLVLGKGNEGRQKYGTMVYEYPTDARLVCQALQQRENRTHLWESGSSSQIGE